MHPAEKPVKTPRILLLDDECEIVEACARALRGSFLVVKTNSPFEAVSFMDCGRTKIDLVVCDYNMAGMNGPEFVKRIRSLGIATPVVLFTGEILNEREHQVSCFLKVLLKPFDAKQLIYEISGALKLIEEQALARKPLNGIAPHLELAMANLRNFLEHRGICDPALLNPEKAIELLGAGEEFSIYLSWLYLYELSNKPEKAG